jgi:hypothetical protein
LLLAEIFTRKTNYARAIVELQTYLDLVPHVTNADAIHEQMAKLEKLNGPSSRTEKQE